MRLWVLPTTGMHSLGEISDANTQILSGPLTLIRSLSCLEGQMVVVGIGVPGLTPLPIAGWLALGYEALYYAMGTDSAQSFPPNSPLRTVASGPACPLQAGTSFQKGQVDGPVLTGCMMWIVFPAPIPKNSKIFDSTWWVEHGMVSEPHSVPSQLSHVSSLQGRVVGPIETRWELLFIRMTSRLNGPFLKEWRTQHVCGPGWTWSGTVWTSVWLRFLPDATTSPHPPSTLAPGGH